MWCAFADREEHLCSEVAFLGLEEPFQLDGVVFFSLVRLGRHQYLEASLFSAGKSHSALRCRFLGLEEHLRSEVRSPQLGKHPCSEKICFLLCGEEHLCSAAQLPRLGTSSLL